MRAESPPRQSGLPPVCDARIRCLILGSFPSPASLAAGRYYGHPQNHFWRLLGALWEIPLADLPYPERLAQLLLHEVGLWDVYRSCVRPGALDADIRAGIANDFETLLAGTPKLARVCFNGQTAARFAPWFAERGLATVVLPSSSPAYTLAFAEKLRRWTAGLGRPENREN